jgi:hypothetical protein
VDRPLAARPLLVRLGTGPHRRNASALAFTAIAALDGQLWMQDIHSPLTVPVIAQYLLIRPMLDAVVLTPVLQDRVIWQWNASGEYNARSAYRAMFLGQCSILGVKELWKVKAPRKCLFTVWLALQDHCWTAARRRRHDLQDDDACNRRW